MGGILGGKFADRSDAVVVSEGLFEFLLGLELGFLLGGFADAAVGAFGFGGLESFVGLKVLLDMLAGEQEGEEFLGSVGDTALGGTTGELREELLGGLGFVQMVLMAEGTDGDGVDVIDFALFPSEGQESFGDCGPGAQHVGGEDTVTEAFDGLTFLSALVLGLCCC